MTTNEQTERARLQEARILARMFQPNVAVYAYLGEDETDIFDETALYEIRESLRRQKDADARRLFLSRTYEVRRAS